MREMTASQRNMASRSAGVLPPDAWREALRLQAEWGEDAELEAARQADACLDAGDLDGRACWLLVLRALDSLWWPAPGPWNGLG